MPFCIINMNEQFNCIIVLGFHEKFANNISSKCIKMSSNKSIPPFFTSCLANNNNNNTTLQQNASMKKVNNIAIAIVRVITSDN